MAPPLPRPQPFPRPPAYAEVLNLHRGDDSAYMVHSDKYDGHGHFQLVIRPDPGDHFGFKVVLEPDFRFGPNNQYDRARVKVFVDGSVHSALSQNPADGSECFYVPNTLRPSPPGAREAYQFSQDGNATSRPTRRSNLNVSLVILAVLGAIQTRVLSSSN